MSPTRWPDGSGGLAAPPLVNAVLLFGLFGNALGTAFLFAVLPLLGRDIGFSDIQSGALLGLGSLGLLIAAPVLGRMSETWGRRPVLLMGLAGAALSLAAFGVVASGSRLWGLSVGLVFGILISIRLVQTLTTGGLLPVGQAVMADVSTLEHRTRAMGLLGASFGLGGILGAAVLWLVAQDDVFDGFWIVSGISGVAFIAALFLLPETRRDDGNAFEVSRQLLKLDARVLLPFLIITFTGVSTFAAVKQITGLRLQDIFGMATEEALAQTGFILTLSAAAMILSQIVILRLLPLRPWSLVALASVATLFALSLAAGTRDLQLFVSAMVLLGLAQGIMLPANLGLLSVSVGPLAQGKAAGLNAIGQGLGMVVGPIAGPGLFSVGHALPYWVLLAPYGVLLGFALKKRIQEKGVQEMANTGIAAAQDRFSGDAAENYDQRINGLVPGYDTLQQIVPGLLGSLVKDDAHILIVGAGTGKELVALATHNSQWTFVALDPSQSMLDVAARRAESAGIMKRVEFVCADISGVSPSRGFDAAISLLVAHFIADDGAKKSFLESIRSNLNSGASLITADLSIESPQNWSAYKRWAVGTGKSVQEVDAMFARLKANFHPVNEERLEELLTQVGFGPPEPFFQALCYRGYIASSR